jgi:hypothetical protein
MQAISRRGRRIRSARKVKCQAFCGDVDERTILTRAGAQPSVGENSLKPASPKRFVALWSRGFGGDENGGWIENREGVENHGFERPCGLGRRASGVESQRRSAEHCEPHEPPSAEGD